MAERSFNIGNLVSAAGKTSMKVIFQSEIHEIHLWRVAPDEWIYPHIHPYNDDIWYVFQGTGEYYISAKETKKIASGEIAVATPGDVHGIFNSGSEDIVVYSVLSPLPIEMEPAPDFEYPEYQKNLSIKAKYNWKNE